MTVTQWTRMAGPRSLQVVALMVLYCAIQHTQSASIVPRDPVKELDGLSIADRRFDSSVLQEQIRTYHSSSPHNFQTAFAGDESLLDSISDPHYSPEDDRERTTAKQSVEKIREKEATMGDKPDQDFGELLQEDRSEKELAGLLTEKHDKDTVDDISHHQHKQSLHGGYEDDGNNDEKDTDEDDEDKEDSDTKDNEEPVALEVESVTYGQREDTSMSVDEYAGYDSEDENFDGWVEVSNGDQLADDQALGSEPSQRADRPSDISDNELHEMMAEEELQAYRPYLDDVIAASVESDDEHEDVNRDGDTVEVPGFPPLRVIELNETIYINRTDDDSSQPEFEPVRIPDKFEDYDVNKDGLISLPELRDVTGATEGAEQAFSDADINGDGRVDQTEFKMSGWGLPVDSSPSSVADRTVVFVPKEDVQPSSNPRGAEGTSRHARHRLP